MQKSASENRWTEWHTSKISSVYEAPGADLVSETNGWGVHSCVPRYSRFWYIAYHIHDADIYHEVFAYFVDDVERIMKVLDNEAAPIKEECVELE